MGKSRPLLISISANQFVNLVVPSPCETQSYNNSPYSSPLNFPLSSLVKTDHVVRSRAGTICQQNVLGRLSDDSARSVEVAHQRQLSPTVGFAQIIRRGWVVNTLFSCISAFTCLQHHGERFHNNVTTGEN